METSSISTNNINDKKILLVDDEKDILTLYHECLETWGFPIISFDNPINVLNYINTANNILNCSLIITDYRMPQMNGLNFIQHIRERYSSSSQNKISELKIILISAFVISEFTLKEKEILKLVVQGNTSKEIAEKLHKSIHTINTHRKNIFQKTESKTIADLISKSIDNNWI